MFVPASFPPDSPREFRSPVITLPAFAAFTGPRKDKEIEGIPYPLLRFLLVGQAIPRSYSSIGDSLTFA